MNQSGKIKSTPPKSQFALAEERMLAIWAREKTFQLSVDNRQGAEHFEFYDGPPFANGLPHYGHLVSSFVKDAVARYKTMRGYHVPRRFGWDCHGLPAEMKAEQDLELGSKAGIEAYGVKKFIDYCRYSVTQYTKEWESYITRIGRWVDFSDNYYTMDRDYMESVIWAFKQLYDKGLVSEGYKVMPYCHICETSLSNFESKQDESYRNTEDTAITVRFKTDDGLTLLAWTTTPWTIPANLALAVNKDIEYRVMEGNGEKLVIAEDALGRYKAELQGYHEVSKIFGRELVGKKYAPPFNYYLSHENSHVVLHADFISAEEGTGIAHEAPGFGEDDQTLCEANDIEIVVPVDKQGNFTAEITKFAGMNVFEANPHVVDHLINQGSLFKQAKYMHPYPHCWRTDNPLIYKAVSSWIIDVPKLKDELLANNEKINWIPSSMKEGVFGKWLEGVRQWNVSRDRFWGTPIPVWKTDDGEVVVVGSIDEIEELSIDDTVIEDLHKPGIDEVVLKTKDGRLAYRVSDVFDCWFESGAMPFAQHHYPFEKKAYLIMPADFIVEYIGQTRGWFYTLHVLATAIFAKEAFKNVISHGVILGSDGRKMSKRLGNYPELQHVFDSYGADALRYYLFSSPVIKGETIFIDEKAIIEKQRGVLMMLKNSHNFFDMYRRVDRWKIPDEIKLPDKLENELDKWILSRLTETTEEVTKYADKYDITKAVKPIDDLVGDLSNWYIRRSRRRFWKSENDIDKESAYHTLWYTLVRICQLMAPWTPFLTDQLYRDLTLKGKHPLSVHLTDWPKEEYRDQDSLDNMKVAREVITEGLALRAQASIKIRQPLSSIDISCPIALPQQYQEIITSEVNVKVAQIALGEMKVVLDTTVTEELESEGLAREIVRLVQSYRKKSAFQVDDRIELRMSSSDEKVSRAIATHGDYIKRETLAISLNVKDSYEFGYADVIAKVPIKIDMHKASRD